MGAYFQYVNLDLEEVISMSGVTNIKAGAFTHWGLQTAILQLFLGGPSGRSHNPDSLIGRWQGHRIAIECDDYGPEFETFDKDPDGWPDAGMFALAYMRHTKILEPWLTERDLYNRSDEHFNEGIDEWLNEQRGKGHFTNTAKSLGVLQLIEG